jgi:RNA-directed DNA polymerase
MGAKVRVLSIPAIRDRVVQGALKLILEPIFEADFPTGIVWISSQTDST